MKDKMPKWAKGPLIFPQVMEQLFLAELRRKKPSHELKKAFDQFLKEVDDDLERKTTDRTIRTPHR